MSEFVFSKVFAGDHVDIASALVAGDWAWLEIEIFVVPNTSGASVYLLPSTDGGATWLTTAGAFHAHPILNLDSSGAATTAPTTAYNGFLFLGSTSAGNSLDGRIKLFQPNGGSPHKHARLQSEGYIGTFFSWQEGIEYVQSTLSNLGSMFNALRLMVTAGTMEGRITVRGERNVDVAPTPANPVKKVAIIGASLVYMGGYCDTLRAALQSVWTTKTVVVRNFGSNGQGTPGALVNIKSVIASQPDVLVLALCAADAYAGYGISTATSTTNHATIIAAIRAALPSCQIFLMAENPMIGTGATSFPNLATYYANGRSIATAQSVGLIDVAAVWGTPSAGQYQNSDGTHPTPAANASIAVPVMVAALTA